MVYRARAISKHTEFKESENKRRNRKKQKNTHNLSNIQIYWEKNRSISNEYENNQHMIRTWPGVVAVVGVAFRDRTFPLSHVATVGH